MKQQTSSEQSPKASGDGVKNEIETGDLAVFDARTLFEGTREIEIRHDRSFYRLRISGQGKLISNK